MSYMCLEIDYNRLQESERRFSEWSTYERYCFADD